MKAGQTAKKIGEKTREGYAPAVRGVRQRRAVTRRAIASTRSTARQAPVLWRFDSGAPAFGIFVDGERCWVGNQRGDVCTVTHSGTVTGRFRLPDGVKCIVADDFWIYAGTARRTVHRLAKGDGVVVECVRDGERLRVRVVSPGYESGNVQFPKDIREAGARYLVDGVRSPAAAVFTARTARSGHCSDPIRPPKGRDSD
ncbi:hypothetical protein [Nonomuraea harbinensis]|uniref:Uncharacterized protein n=1 Tax=Nonomuraea harbinensis TaxID=1286938 RepID=A0ABW1C618_9ACTN|nr:hypothetical protein [Nonomuraea harbinensis]